MTAVEERPAREVLTDFAAAAGIAIAPSLLRLVGHAVGHEPTHFVPLDQQQDPRDWRWDLDSPPDNVDRQIIIGSPGELILTLDVDGTLSLAEFSVRWYSQDPVALQREEGRVAIAGSSEPSVRSSEFDAAFRRLRRKRRARYRRCIRCDEMTPPEWWHGDGHCQGCAERYLGVVH